MHSHRICIRQRHWRLSQVTKFRRRAAEKLLEADLLAQTGQAQHCGSRRHTSTNSGYKPGAGVSARQAAGGQQCSNSSLSRTLQRKIASNSTPVSKSGATSPKAERLKPKRVFEARNRNLNPKTMTAGTESHRTLDASGDEPRRLRQAADFTLEPASHRLLLAWPTWLRVSLLARVAGGRSALGVVARHQRGEQRLHGLARSSALYQLPQRRCPAPQTVHRGLRTISASRPSAAFSEAYGDHPGESAAQLNSRLTALSLAARARVFSDCSTGERGQTASIDPPVASSSTSARGRHDCRDVEPLSHCVFADVLAIRADEGGARRQGRRLLLRAKSRRQARPACLIATLTSNDGQAIQGRLLQLASESLDLSRGQRNPALTIWRQFYNICLQTLASLHFVTSLYLSCQTLL
uniref:Uncharacterized protein n=1 Tax=Macrostomum lignano TaxID=282301 RepID=A0A1I8F957_9PLAT